ncbi:MAG: RodZ domain-containing protein [Candidatus Omnitrophota bacterium]
MSSNPTDVGLLLKQERERKGIGLDVVHEATKVPMDALRAIEEGYKVRTLTAFYYKSFVKIYAQYLGLDANHVVNLIPTHHPKPPVNIPSKNRPGAPIRPVPVSGTGAQAVEGVRSWNLLVHPMILKKKRKVFKFVVIAAGAVVLVMLAGLLLRKAVSLIQAMPSNKSVTVKASRPKPEMKKDVIPADRQTDVKDQPAAEKKTVEVKSGPARARIVESKTASSKVEKPVERNVQEKDTKVADPAPSTLKQVSITVRAKNTTWIRIDVDATGTAFQGRLKKGNVATFRGTKKIVLTANDIGALEFEINGRSVGVLSRNYLKAKKVVVTPEGLTVEK